MIDKINELPEDGLKSSPKRLCYTENKWISLKNQNKLYFLHLIEFPVSLNLYVLVLFIVNGPQALYVNPGLPVILSEAGVMGYLRCISSINISPANEKLYTGF